MARNLKVFQARFGFYDSVVAAPSQAAALRAWGAHQNLFRDGEARVADDQKAIAAALAEPGVPLRRAIGSHDAFSLNPGLPKLPDVPDRKPMGAKFGMGAARTHARTPSPPRSTPTINPPDRSALDRAETAMENGAAAHSQEEQSFRERRDAIDAEEAAATKRYEEAHAQAMITVKRERLAYDKLKRQYDKSR